MAPEQFEGRNLPASDVYALGLLACELLYGQPDVRAVPGREPRRVRRLLDAAVAFDPAARPKDVQAWATELGAVLAAEQNGRRLAGRLALLASILLLVLTGYAVMRPEPVSDDRIIEKIGAFDPLDEKFQVHGAVHGTVIQSPDHTRYIGWSVASQEPGGGYYFRALSDAQKRRALSRGWILSAVMQPDESAAFSVVDFAGAGNRFDINVLIEAEGYRVRLNTQIVPTWEGLEVWVPGPNPAFHKYELRFDASLQTASLWIDGEKRLEGYRGHSQFQSPGSGVLFGTTPYRNQGGLALFQAVRFEINP
jgi:hypothetical protein